MHNKGININRIMYYAIIILMIMQLTTEWKFIYYGSRFNYIFWFLLIAALVLAISLLVRTTGLTRNSILILLGIILYLAGYAFATHYKIVYFFRIYVLVFALFYIYAALLLRKNQLTSFMNCYENVVIAIAVCSLVFWFFGSVLHIMPGRSMISYFWAGQDRIGYTYFNLYYENPLQNDQYLLGIMLSRNCGIFTEVPAFANILLFALSVELFVNHSNNRGKLFILLVTLLSTQSTKALIILISLVILKYMVSIKDKSWQRRVLSLGVFSVMILLGIAAVVVILQDKAKTGSFTVRLSDMIAGCRTFLHHPLFGVGFFNNPEVIKYSTVVRTNETLSMGLFVLPAQGGIYLFLFYLMALFLPLHNRKRITGHKTDYALFSFVLCVNLLISNSWADVTYLFFLAMAYAVFAESLKYSYSSSLVGIRGVE